MLPASVLGIRHQHTAQTLRLNITGLHCSPFPEFACEMGCERRVPVSGEGQLLHLDSALPGSTHKYCFDIMISSSLQNDFQNKLNDLLERGKLDFWQMK